MKDAAASQKTQLTNALHRQIHQNSVPGKHRRLKP